MSAPLTVAALYHFAPVPDLAGWRGRLAALCRAEATCGTLLIAPEGINGTIAGSQRAIAAVLAAIRAEPGFAALEAKFSAAPAAPFYRMKVRVKREIVTMGEPGLDPRRGAGIRVPAAAWNALIADPDTVVIDTRNAYEVAIGTFERAIDPGTCSFREFPGWFRQHRSALLGEGAPRKVAMFCTGGIRCEKATALLRAEGIEEVYHLDGGILKYLETVPAAESLWRGDCFVFDERVSVGHGLAPGPHRLCRACRRPLDPEALAHPHYEEGVSCAACHDERDEASRAGYRERHRQQSRAEARGARHIGATLTG